MVDSAPPPPQKHVLNMTGSWPTSKPLSDLKPGENHRTTSFGIHQLSGNILLSLLPTQDGNLIYFTTL
jgi:hypothetical protein